MRILLIEPDHLLASTYTKALADAGHNVDWQRDSQSAILAADRQAPDTVILEPQLSGHNGIEFLYEFRSYPEWQSIPVVFNSFAPDYLTAEQKEVLGVTAHLYKPTTSLSKLVQSII